MRRREWLRSTGQLVIQCGLSTALWPSAAWALQPNLETIKDAGPNYVATLSDGSLAELTLQGRFQEAARQLLAAAHPVAGAALLVDLSSGNLLAFAQYRRSSYPSVQVLLDTVPSASLFKIVTATALLERGHVHPKTRVCFSGGQHRIERRHLEAPPASEGLCSRFSTALGFSRNAVFAQLATQHLLHRDLLQTAQRLGFNAPLPFDVPAQVGSVELPYNDLQFARAAAGFVGSKLTPLGAAHLASAIALGGCPVRLRLLHDPNSERELLPRVMSANSAWRLTRMLEVTVHSGTSLEAFSDPQGQSYLGAVRVAGKTGTLQATPQSPTTSWFTGFAPSRTPRVAVTVMLQNSHVWRRKANELARDLLRVYFAGQPGITDPFD